MICHSPQIRLRAERSEVSMSPRDPKNIPDEVSGPIDPNTRTNEVSVPKDPKTKTNEVSVDPVVQSRRMMKMSERPLNPVAAVDNPQATIETQRVMKLNPQTARYQISLS